jgi:hypothetical protein
MFYPNMKSDLLIVAVKLTKEIQIHWFLPDHYHKTDSFFFFIRDWFLFYLIKGNTKKERKKKIYLNRRRKRKKNRYFLCFFFSYLSLNFTCNTSTNITYQQIDKHCVEKR